ncbi:MAG: hypothetical protein M8353_04735 [ANME-2 cluster archaeon]|nr:hypothetical protein [ANME-2 cluster archaeon]
MAALCKHPGGPEEDPTGGFIAAHESAGEIKTVSFAPDNLRIAELERRKRPADEGNV